MIAGLLILGIFLLAIGALLVLISGMRNKSDETKEERKEKGNFEGGVVILIGPLPIVLGKNPKIVKELLLFAGVFFVLVLVVYLVLGWLSI